MFDHINNYTEKLSKILNDKAMEKVPLLGNALLEAWKHNKSIYLCGNGGSAGNARSVFLSTAIDGALTKKS